MVEAREYVPAGRSTSVFGDWFLGVDTRARQLVDDAIARMRLGNMGNCKRVGFGVLERRIDSGPGDRIYFWAGRRQPDPLARWEHQTTSTAGHRRGPGSLARVQAAQTKGKLIWP